MNKLNNRRIFTIKIFIAQIVIAVLNPVYSERGHHHEGRWHRGNIHHFEMHDRTIWNRGHWRHMRYGGRFGWWWVVGPSWYYYPRPIYPHPDPYTPPAVIVQPSTQQNPSTPPPVQNWYFCQASNEYYPYISTCPSGWKIVPATPAK